MQPRFRSFSTFGDCMLQLKKKPGPVATLTPGYAAFVAVCRSFERVFSAFFPALANGNKPPATQAPEGRDRGV